MKVFNVLAKFSLVLLVIITIEGLLTYGSAFNFENYNLIGYIAQTCILIIGLRVSLESWGQKK